MTAWYGYEKLFSFWIKIKQKKACGGLDNRSVEDYSRHIGKRIRALSKKLEQHNYSPVPGKRINILKPDGSRRPICLGTIEDKIVQMAVKEAIEPLFEPQFLECSFAYRPGRGHRQAIHRVQMFLSQKMHWVTSCDIDNFFDTICHDLLLQKLKEKINNAYFIELIQLWIKIGSFLGDRYIENREGVPQGGVISPLLSNIYLHSFDREMLGRKAHYVRYADDFIILEKEKNKAAEHYQFASNYLSSRLHLKLNKIEPAVYHLQKGFTFLGIQFFPQKKLIDPQKFEKALNKVEIIFGKALKISFGELISNLNEAIRGWQYYYGECDSQKEFLRLQNKIFHKLAYTIHRLSEEGRIPEKTYLQHHLNRLKLLIDLEKTERKKLFNQVRKGEKLKLSRLGSNAETEGKKDNRERKAGKPLNEGKIKRQVKIKVRKYQRRFASQYDLVLSNYGIFLGKHSKRLVVKQPGHKTKEYAVSKIKHILVLNSSVSVSSAAVYLCAKNNIPIDYLDYTGRPFARLAAPEQPAWHYGVYQVQAEDNGKAVHLAKAFVEGKIRNQLSLIKYYSKYRKGKDDSFRKLFNKESRLIDSYLQELEKIREKGKIKSKRGHLFGIEGRAAGAYWSVVKYILRKRTEFEGRQHREARDLVNVLLNYGYGILYSRVWGALMLAGLNVQISFLHAPQYQKPTLVFDVVEEFRSQVVDRVVISMLNRGEKFHLSNGRLSRESRNKLVENIFERFNTPVRFGGRERTIQEVILYQCRRIGKYLKDEIPSYQPFLAKW